MLIPLTQVHRDLRFRGAPTFPKTLRGFRERFADEQACVRYLWESRWPEAFCFIAFAGEWLTQAAVAFAVE